LAAALIVIEIAAPKVSEDALSVLVSACSRAARDAECVLARNANEEQPAAVAIVTLQSEDKIRVEVGVRQGDRDSWRTKDFAFLAADERMDRWRAVGFAIGTLAESSPAPDQDTSVRVAPSSPSSASPSSASTSATAAAPNATSPGTASSPSASAPPASAEKAEKAEKAASAASAAKAVSPPEDDHPDERQRPVRESPPGTQMFIGAAAIFGPGLDAPSSFRLGGALSVDLAPAQIPLFFTLGGSAATDLGAGSSDVTARWFDVSLGAGVPVLGRLDASGLEFRAQVVAEYFDARASVFRSQLMSRWTAGLQGTFGGRLQIVPNLLLAAEVQAAGLTGETPVSVDGRPVGNSAAFRFLGSLGLRVRFR
jgi:hypothetical protein